MPIQCISSLARLLGTNHPHACCSVHSSLNTFRPPLVLKVCFFAHSPDQLRTPEQGAPPLPLTADPNFIAASAAAPPAASQAASVMFLTTTAAAATVTATSATGSPHIWAVATAPGMATASCAPPQACQAQWAAAAPGTPAISCGPPPASMPLACMAAPLSSSPCSSVSAPASSVSAPVSSACAPLSSARAPFASGAPAMQQLGGAASPWAPFGSGADLPTAPPMVQLASPFAASGAAATSAAPAAAAGPPYRGAAVHGHSIVMAAAPLGPGSAQGSHRSFPLRMDWGALPPQTAADGFLEIAGTTLLHTPTGRNRATSQPPPSLLQRLPFFPSTSAAFAGGCGWI